MVADSHFNVHGWREQKSHSEAYLLAPLQHLLRELVSPPRSRRRRLNSIRA